jgi:hypothetical protein
MKTQLSPLLIIQRSILLALSVILFSMVASAQNQRYTYDDFLKMQNSSRQDFPPGWDFQTNSSDPHGIIVFASANPRINDIPLEAGDFIGAFYTDDNGELKCGGADFWPGDENIIFAAFGDDPDTPEKDGFAPAEIIHFKVFLQQTQKAYDIDFIQWDPGYFSTNKWFPFGLSAMVDVECSVDFDAYATATPDEICLGDEVTLEAAIFIESTGNYSYQWTSNPEGFTASEPTVMTMPAETTHYLLEVSDGINISSHQVTVIVNENPAVNAGSNQSICEGEPVVLSAAANSFSSVLWSTSGDGTFSDALSPESVYYPGTGDVTTEDITLTITAAPIAPCTISSSDEILVTLIPLPEITTPASLTFCISAPVLLIAETAHAGSLLWTTSGDGSFDDATQPSVQYFPGEADLSAGSFVLTATAQAVSPCQTPAETSTTITLKNLPTVNAPSSRLICEGSPANLNGIAFNASSVLWVTQGDGTFANANVTATQYFPGEADLIAGSATVTLRAYGTAECEAYFSYKNIQITINKNPLVSAGDDMIICETGQLFLSATAENYSFVLWSTNGDGFFTNAGILNPVYFPGPQDKINGQVLLTVTANPISPCSLSVSDTLQAEIVPEAEVFLFPVNDSICYGAEYTFSGVEYEHTSTVNWFTTNGSGTFDDAGSLYPTYTPDPLLDYPLGCIVIGVAAQSTEPCQATSYAYMNLCFVAGPEVYSGSDKTIVSGESCMITDAVASGFSSLLWQTTGDGTFSNIESLTTEYFPGTSEINNQQATLYLTAMPLEGCGESISDSAIITIHRTQSFNMNAGIAGFSLYINQNEKTFQDVIAPLEGNIKYAKAMDKVFWPEYGINTIGNFSNDKGYIIFLNEPAGVEYTGMEISDKQIMLDPGWNLLPAVASCNLDTQFIIDQLAGNLIIMVEVGGNGRIYPAGDIYTLSSVEPGKAYLIKVSQAVPLTFPSCF